MYKEDALRLLLLAKDVVNEFAMKSALFSRATSDGEATAKAILIAAVFDKISTRDATPQ